MAKSLRLILVTLAAILILGCSGASGTTVAPVSESELAGQKPNAGTASAATANQAAPSVTPDTPKPASAQTATGAKPADSRVELVYFHAAQRCVTCLCFEEHVNTVVDKYFQDAVSKGKLVYSVLNVQDVKNKALAQKYKAVGSQLFINTVMNGVDNIVDVQEIWDWECRSKPDSFEQKVKTEIERYLKTVM